jgi:hypothetical protein
MFSDRWWIFKVACALFFLAAVCRAGQNLLNDRHPPVERVAVFTDDLRNKTIALMGKKVLRSDAEGFEIASRVAPVRVLTSQPPPVGVYVSLVGRPTGPGTLTASAVQINAGWAWKRPLNYIVSILVVLAYGWAVRDRFRWRIRDGVFLGKY